ncbi:MAG: polysaccharide biosynthesis PFTS motif protein [Deltaproteobacteria bacterium]|nr:polysaccharide biosynthesis PFTS motif protein [Deltaproteobacteria bacterium]
MRINNKEVRQPKEIVTGCYYLGYVNKAFDRIVRRIETWLMAKVPEDVGLFDERIIRERLAQAIVATSRDSYGAYCAHRLTQGLELIPPDDQVLKIGGLVIDSRDGSVSLSPRRLVRSIAHFAYSWLLFLGSIMLGVLPQNGQNRRPATVLLGLGLKAILYQDSDVRFVRFCREGPILPLAKATRLLVQTTEGSGNISNPDIIYSRNPISDLVRDSHLGARGRCKLLLSHMLIPFRVLMSLIRFPVLGLIVNDIAYIPSIQTLDHAELLEAVLITNSSFSSQPLWMRGSVKRRFRVHEIHYSQNTLGFQYVKDPIIVGHPAFRHVSVDEHWVWTSGYKVHLVELGHRGAIHVVGPIMWYLPEPPLDRTDNEIQIVVFDVTPIYDHIATRMGIVSYYCCNENVLRFIDDIVGVCQELEPMLGVRIRILMKHKRSFTNGFHDQRYIDRIQVLEKTQARFDLVNYDENLFSLLESCDLSISIPYTSTAYISSHLMKPAIYFDPSQQLLPTHEPTPYIQFVSGRAELLKAMLRIIAPDNENRHTSSIA